MQRDFRREDDGGEHGKVNQAQHRRGREPGTALHLSGRGAHRKHLRQIEQIAEDEGRPEKLQVVLEDERRTRHREPRVELGSLVARPVRVVVRVVGMEVMAGTLGPVTGETAPEREKQMRLAKTSFQNRFGTKRWCEDFVAQQADPVNEHTAEDKRDQSHRNSNPTWQPPSLQVAQGEKSAGVKDEDTSVFKSDTR